MTAAEANKAKAGREGENREDQGKEGGRPDSEVSERALNAGSPARKEKCSADVCRITAEEPRTRLNATRFMAFSKARLLTASR